MAPLLILVCRLVTVSSFRMSRILPSGLGNMFISSIKLNIELLKRRPRTGVHSSSHCSLLYGDFKGFSSVQLWLRTLGFGSTEILFTGMDLSILWSTLNARFRAIYELGEQDCEGLA